MNINTARSQPRFPQFSPALKDPQKLEITYTAPSLEYKKLGEIPAWYEDGEVYEPPKKGLVGRHLYQDGEDYHKNPEGDTQYVKLYQPVRESNGALIPTKKTKYFSYDPDKGLPQRRIKGSLLGAAIGTAAGAAVSLLSGSDLFSSILIGATAGTGTGALSQWNSKAPLPTLEWEKKDVSEAKLLGYEHSLRPWVESSFRGDHSWLMVDNEYEPILEKNVVGSYYEPVLRENT